MQETLVAIRAGLKDLHETEGLELECFIESHKQMIAACDNEAITGLLNNCLYLKRPAVFKSSIENTLKAIDQILEPKDEKELVSFADQQLADAKDLKSVMKRSATVISKQINRIGKCCMIMGGELSRVKDLLNNQNAFLEWIKDEFGMGKSQAYALISAYKEFKDNPAMQLLPVRVLRIIGGVKEKSIKAQLIAEVTEEVKQNGTVSIKDTEDLKVETEVLNSVKQSGPKDGRESSDAGTIKKLEKDGSSTELKKVTEVQEKVEQAFKTLADVEGGIEDDTGHKASLSIQQPVDDSQAALKAANKLLKQAVERYKLEIQNIKAKQVPWLAQFNNAEPWEKLGIPKGCVDSVVILAHERLTQVWSKESSPKAFDLLNCALESLTAIGVAV